MTLEELHNQYQKNEMGHISKNEVQRVFDIFDTDGDGTVEFKEFIVTCILPTKMLRYSSVNAFFKYFQPDANNEIKYSRIVRVLKRYAYDEIHLSNF